METKNVIAAIALSSAVIVLYSLFFAPEQTVSKKKLAEKNKIEQNTDTPTIEEKKIIPNIIMNLMHAMLLSPVLFFLFVRIVSH